MKNLPTLRNDSSFAVQFSISVSKTRAILLFTIKIIEMFEVHASMPRMWSLNIIIMHNYANVRQSTIQNSGGDDVTGQHYRRCWEEKTTRSNRMKFRLQMKHLEVRQNYSAACRIFNNSLLNVLPGDETLPLMLDMLPNTWLSSFALPWNAFPKRLPRSLL